MNDLQNSDRATPDYFPVIIQQNTNLSENVKPPSYANRNYCSGRADDPLGLTFHRTTIQPSVGNLEASTSWNPQGLSRPLMGLRYLQPDQKQVPRAATDSLNTSQEQEGTAEYMNSNFRKINLIWGSGKFHKLRHGVACYGSRLADAS
jgi:hypothetical protein